MKHTIIRWTLALSAMTLIFAGDDVLNQLNITREQAERYVAESLQSKQLWFSGSAVTLSGAARAELVKVMGTIAKPTQSLKPSANGMRSIASKTNLSQASS